MDSHRPARPQEGQELGLTDSVWEMTVRCWDQDPAQRPTMTEVVGLLQESLASSRSIEADLVEANTALARQSSVCEKQLMYKYLTQR